FLACRLARARAGRPASAGFRSCVARARMRAFRRSVPGWILAAGAVLAAAGPARAVDQSPQAEKVATGDEVSELRRELSARGEDSRSRLAALEPRLAALETDKTTGTPAAPAAPSEAAVPQAPAPGPAPQAPVGVPAGAAAEGAPGSLPVYGGGSA